MTIDYNIKYVPLFDQTQEGLLDKFVEIEMDARAGAYGQMFMYGAFDSYYEKYAANLKNYKNNMAIGAFKDGKMIAFVNGYVEYKGEIWLDSLFVDPDYRKQFGIGTRLLSKFEDAAYMVASKARATSLSGSKTFYKKRGYRLHQYSDEVEKQLKMPLLGVVPVFHWYKRFRIKSNVTVDDKWLRQNVNRPIFVYIGPSHEIEGVGALGKNDEKRIWVNTANGKGAAGIYEAELMKYLDKCR